MRKPGKIEVSPQQIIGDLGDEEAYALQTRSNNEIVSYTSLV